jgi:hypothetical protein
MNILKYALSCCSQIAVEELGVMHTQAATGHRDLPNCRRQDLMRGKSTRMQTRCQNWRDDMFLGCEP